MLAKLIAADALTLKLLAVGMTKDGDLLTKISRHRHRWSVARVSLVAGLLPCPLACE
jgi:hypothetical protein